MNFRVQWFEQAENELIEVWLASRDRNAMTRSIDALDAELRSNPFAVGESREDTASRVWVGDGVGVNLVVFEDLQFVFVTAAFAVPKKRR